MLQNQTVSEKHGRNQTRRKMTKTRNRQSRPHVTLAGITASSFRADKERQTFASVSPDYRLALAAVTNERTSVMQHVPYIHANMSEQCLLGIALGYEAALRVMASLAQPLEPPPPRQPEIEYHDAEKDGADGLPAMFDT